jgi:hypothetical protein
MTEGKVVKAFDEFNKAYEKAMSRTMSMTGILDMNKEVTDEQALLTRDWMKLAKMSMELCNVQAQTLDELNSKMNKVLDKINK